jgi:transcriptional regulator with XRE-family HTH domain
VRRTFCGLSQQQLGARLGIDFVDVDAYEQGAKHIRCKLLLETAKQLKTSPRFFFQWRRTGIRRLPRARASWPTMRQADPIVRRRR